MAPLSEYTYILEQQISVLNTSTYDTYASSVNLKANANSGQTNGNLSENAGMHNKQA
jgi:hypothetical protein